MDMEEMTERLLAKMAANLEDILARMDAMFDAHRKRTMACLGQTEANTEKIDPGMMQSVEEHKDVPSEDVAVMPVKGLKKQRRGRKSTAERRRKPKKGTRGYPGSRRKVTVAGKRTSYHATVAWLKTKVFRRSGIQEICGWHKELAIAGIRTTHCAQVVRRMGRSHEGTSVEQGRQKNQTKNKFARGTSKSRTPRRRQRATQQGNNRTRKRNPKELRQERMGNVIQTFGKTTGLRFAERVS
jgi:hypothetical protein